MGVGMNEVSPIYTRLQRRNNESIREILIQFSAQSHLTRDRSRAGDEKLASVELLLGIQAAWIIFCAIGGVVGISRCLSPSAL